MFEADYINRTKDWISRFVIGLNLCPFAKAPFEEDKIRYVSCDEDHLIVIVNLILEEAQLLLNSDPSEIETTLIILPLLDLPFEAFQDMVNIMSDVLSEQKLEKFIQLVGFHPHFRYEKADPTNLGNYTNRSPYPMIHLLQQASIEAVAIESMGEDIAARNAELLENLGIQKIQALLQK